MNDLINYSGGILELKWIIVAFTVQGSQAFASKQDKRWAYNNRNKWIIDLSRNIYNGKINNEHKYINEIVKVLAMKNARRKKKGLGDRLLCGA